MNNPEKINEIIKKLLSSLRNHQVEIHDGCAACHVIFSLRQDLQQSEQDAADLLTEILTNDKSLNEEFIETVEQIHMKERGLGGAFVKRERESKDSYLEAYFKNVLAEISSDMKVLSPELILRKLLLSYIGLYMAQTLGVDYHAATEETYYLLRKEQKIEKEFFDIIKKLEIKMKTS